MVHAQRAINLFPLLLSSPDPAWIVLPSGEFQGVMTDDNFLTLDEMAKDVARMVEGAETHLGPVLDWTDAFKWWVVGVRGIHPLSPSLDCQPGSKNLVPAYEQYR